MFWSAVVIEGNDCLHLRMDKQKGATGKETEFTEARLIPGHCDCAKPSVDFFTLDSQDASNFRRNRAYRIELPYWPRYVSYQGCCVLNVFTLAPDPGWTASRLRFSNTRQNVKVFTRPFDCFASHETETDTAVYFINWC